jgi:hypothetical protein
MPARGGRGVSVVSGLFDIIFVFEFALAVFLGAIAAIVVLATSRQRSGHELSRRQVEQKKRNQYLARHGQAALGLATATFPSKDQFAFAIWRLFHDKRLAAHLERPAAEIIGLLEDAALAVYEAEIPLAVPKFVEPDATAWTEYDAQIEAVIAKCARPLHFYELLVNSVTESLFSFHVLISRALAQTAPSGPFAVQLNQRVKNLPAILNQSFVKPFCNGRIAGQRWQLPVKELTRGMGNCPYLDDRIMRASPFDGLLRRLPCVKIPFSLPDWARLDHQWIVAPRGKERTQMLEAMLSSDLDRVRRKEGSIIVIDRRGDLSREISSLKMFAPGQSLSGALTLIEPTASHPLALNFFSPVREPTHTVQSQKNSRVSSASLELTEFALAGLFWPNLTFRHRRLLRCLSELVLLLPGASITTFRDILRPGGLLPYQYHLQKLSADAREFFEGYERQCAQGAPHGVAVEELLAHLDEAMSDANFRALFCQTENKLDLVRELNQPKVLLINLAQLPSYAESFGRFVIAALLRAIAQRSMLTEFPIHTFCYVEDCYHYVSDDQQVRSFLELARANSVGFVFTSDYVEQVAEPKVRETLADMAILATCGLNERDARFFAPKMRSTPDKLLSQPEGSVSIFVKGLTDEVLSVTTLSVMEKMERVSERELTQLREQMQVRYLVSPPQSRQPFDPKYDLRWAATISPRTAERGGRVKVHNLWIMILAGTTNGTVLRLKGKGVPKPDRTRGHLYLTVNVPRPPVTGSEQPAGKGLSRSVSGDRIFVQGAMVCQADPNGECAA